MRCHDFGSLLAGSCFSLPRRSEAESCQSAMKQAQQSHDAKLRKASDMESRMKLQLTELQGDLDGKL